MRDVILHCGSFGRGFSGKTHLNKSFSKSYWKNHAIKSLVLDPNKENWGPQAWVTDDEEKFWHVIWKCETACAVFVDEAAETIKRDNDKVSLFTRIRHRGHRMHVMGHSGVNLLPQQREQLHCLFLFQQTEKAAKMWVETFIDPRIMESTTLNQYEFLRCILYGDNGKNFIRKEKLMMPQGVFA